MQLLDGSNNSFSGDLPEQIFNGVWLESMDYSGNNMTGTLSSAITSYGVKVC